MGTYCIVYAQELIIMYIYVCIEKNTTTEKRQLLLVLKKALERLALAYLKTKSKLNKFY